MRSYYNCRNDLLHFNDDIWTMRTLEYNDTLIDKDKKEHTIFRIAPGTIFTSMKTIYYTNNGAIFHNELDNFKLK